MCVGAEAFDRAAHWLRGWGLGLSIHSPGFPASGKGGKKVANLSLFPSISTFSGYESSCSPSSRLQPLPPLSSACSSLCYHLNFFFFLSESPPTRLAVERDLFFSFSPPPPFPVLALAVLVTHFPPELRLHLSPFATPPPPHPTHHTFPTLPFPQSSCVRCPRRILSSVCLKIKVWKFRCAVSQSTLAATLRVEGASVLAPPH